MCPRLPSILYVSFHCYCSFSVSASPRLYTAHAHFACNLASTKAPRMRVRPCAGGSKFGSHSMKGKKRAAKSTDFPRKKRKLGKGKRPTGNATNISFKSRSIVLPSQLEQSQQPTGKRKLTFEVRLCSPPN